MEGLFFMFEDWSKHVAFTSTPVLLESSSAHQAADRDFCRGLLWAMASEVHYKIDEQYSTMTGKVGLASSKICDCFMIPLWLYCTYLLVLNHLPINSGIIIRCCQFLYVQIKALMLCSITLDLLNDLF